jgi:cell division septal protein FtsQ
VALGAGLLETALLAWLLGGPLFVVRHVDVHGDRWMAPADVVAAARLERPGSVLALDADSIRRNLGRASWVKSASVDARLPDRVVVEVREWQPVASYRSGPDGRTYYLSPRAVVLGNGRPDPALADIQGPPTRSPKPGDRPLDPELLTAIVNLDRGLPEVIGQRPKGWEVDGCASLTLDGRRGWKVFFGRVLTPEEFAALPAKVAALKTVRSEVDFDNPDLEYVNVVNPSQAAVKYRSAKPPAPTPTPSAGVKPVPAPPATPTPGGIEVRACQ